MVGRWTAQQEHGATIFDSEPGPAGPGAIPLPSLSIHTPPDFTLTVRCPVTQLPISTPLRAAAWHRLLAGMLDRRWAHRLVYDIIHGVDIGYRGKRTLQVDSRNFTSCPAEDAAVSQSMEEEAALGRIAGPFRTSPYRHYRCSPIKTVPKKGSTGKYRIIHHLSHPHGRSINSSTADWPCRLSRFSDAVDIVRRLGRGCYMAKVDIQAAYRCIPVRPEDWPMLGMRWDGDYYFHKTLPFGLRSSCHLWERYATAAEWIIKHVYGVRNIVHYVDDSFLAAAAQRDCDRDLDRVIAAMAELGGPVADKKTVPACTSIIYLGILIDSSDMSIRLDPERLDAIRQLLTEWEQRATCSLRQLQATIGTLQWASQVVRPGRTFLQHLRDLAAAHSSRRPHDTDSITIGADAREDLRWWSTFTSQWNGISLLWDEEWLDRSSILQPHTDACVHGYAAVCGRSWFHATWTEQQEQLARDDGMGRDSMPWKELYAIVAAAATWGHAWQRRKVVFITDCMPVVHAVTKGASRTRRIMQLIRQLHLYSARHHFHYRIEHIAGVDNFVADELSRVHDSAQLSTRCRSAIDPSPIIPVLPDIPS